ncbi:MAG TPA: hypothetical protein VGK90_07215 [Rhizomicrobium sp.]|jgi:hypothetical protein
MKDNPELDSLALEHAWKWFEYHANQRMTMIRFYLTVAGAIATGVGYLWTSDQHALSGTLSFVGIVVSLCFARLDARVSQLIKVGEGALKGQQHIIASRLNNRNFAICEMADRLRADDGKRLHLFPHSYSENFKVMLYLAATVFLGMLVSNIVIESNYHAAFHSSPR